MQAEAVCLAWPECGGVVCHTIYEGYCLARRNIDPQRTKDGMWAYTKGTGSEFFYTGALNGSPESIDCMGSTCSSTDAKTCCATTTKSNTGESDKDVIDTFNGTHCLAVASGPIFQQKQMFPETSGTAKGERNVTISLPTMPVNSLFDIKCPLDWVGTGLFFVCNGKSTSNDIKQEEQEEGWELSAMKCEPPSPFTTLWGPIDVNDQTQSYAIPSQKDTLYYRLFVHSVDLSSSNQKSEYKALGGLANEEGPHVPCRTGMTLETCNTACDADFSCKSYAINDKKDHCCLKDKCHTSSSANNGDNTGWVTYYRTSCSSDVKAEDNVLRVAAVEEKSLAIGCFKELSKMESPEKCAEAVVGEPACVVKNAFSYGFGSRSQRCICDIRMNCELKDHEEFRRYEKTARNVGEITFAYLDGTVDLFRFRGNGNQGFNVYNPKTSAWSTTTLTSRSTATVISNVMMSEAGVTKKYNINCLSFVSCCCVGGGGVVAINGKLCIVVVQN